MGEVGKVPSMHWVLGSIPALPESGMLARVYNTSSQKMKADGSEVQKIEVILGYIGRLRPT